MRTLCIAFAVASVLTAQTQFPSLTITASRSVSIQPDEVVFSINITASAEKELPAILPMLAKSGITAANLSSVTLVRSGDLSRPAAATLAWLFLLPAPISKQKDTIADLTALQQSIGQNGSGLQMVFSLAGMQSSQARASEACSFADLIADARAQAQKLADDAHLKVGSIVALSDAPIIAADVGLPVSRIYAPRWFDTSFASFLLGSFAIGETSAPGAVISPQVTCQVAATFVLAP